MRRGKVKIKPIASAKARHVCFSKRRQVVIKKANELGIVCGVNVAVAVFSPAGHITNRRNDNGDETYILHELNLKYQQLQQENEAENKKSRMSQQTVNNEHVQHVILEWLASDANVRRLHELEAFDSNLNMIDDTVNLYHVFKNAKQEAKPQATMNVPTTSQRIAPSP